MALREVTSSADRESAVQSSTPNKEGLFKGLSHDTRVLVLAAMAALAGVAAVSQKGNASIGASAAGMVNVEGTRVREATTTPLAPLDETTRYHHK